MQRRTTLPSTLARRILSCIGLFLLPVTGGVSSTTYAQQTDSSLEARDVGGLDDTVTLARTQMSVGTALQTISAKTGLDIAYGDHLVPTEKRVELSQRKADVRTLLQEILKGTGVGWRQWISGQVVLVRERDSSSAAVVQEGTIEGTVQERRTGEPIPGVNVVIESLNLGDVTETDGQFEIEDVPVGEHGVSAQFVGYETATETVEVSEGEIVRVDFSLRRSEMEMDEIVVTGTGGDAQRREIGNSISQISEESIDETVSTFGDVLQGQVAGVSVLTNSGQVGAGRTIRLRGNSSVSQGNTPLIYIDGIRVQNENVGDDIEVNQTANVLDDINPSDIENIEIIKGPAATTLYGSEASNGVIQIFTKRGGQGSARIRFSTEQGVNYLEQVGTQDVHSELGINDCSEDPGCPEDGDWLERGHTQEYNLSARGGTGTVNYYLSGRWGKSNGAFDAPQLNESYSVRGNFDFTVLESLSLQFNSFYSRREITWIPDGNNADGLLLNAIRGDQAPVPDEAQTLDMGLRTNSDHFTTGVTFNWAPWANVGQSFKIGVDYVLSEYIEERPFGYVREPQGNRENQTEINVVGSVDYSGSVEFDVGESLSSTTSWGGQLYRDVFNSLEVFGEDFSGIGDKVVTSGAQTEVRDEDRIVTYTGGFFAQERVGWRNRLFVTLGLRVDGSSTFGDDFGLAPYPKASASYLVSEQDFWPDWWESLKLRGAYGESGRLPGPFDAKYTYDSVPGENGRPGLSPGSPGNADLGPERTREFEAGFEGQALDGRLSGSFTWYRQRTYDAIMDVQPAPSLGVPGSASYNIGKIASEGYEMDLDVGVLEAENMSWTVGGSFSINHTEALDLDGQEVYIGWDQEVREGSSVPSFFGNELENPDQIPENPENIQYKNDLQNLGPTYPEREVGVHTSLVLWDDLTIELRADGKYGHVLSAGTARENAERGIWPGCSDVADQITAGDYSGLTARQLGRCDPQQIRDGQWVFPADFFRFRSASIGYRLPASVLPSVVNRLDVQLQARNLFIVTDYPGLDPEAYEDGGADEYRQEYYNLPPTKSVTFTLSAGF